MCDFKMFNLVNTNSVELTAVIQGPVVEAAYDNQEFEVMTIEIDDSTETVTFVVEQPGGQQIAAQGRPWCRMDDEPWKPFEQSGNKLTYDAAVPTTPGESLGYELRFALADEVNNPNVIWRDPKMIISRKGQFMKQQYAAR